MKKLILVLATVFFAHAASAQFGFGIKGGINLNKIHTDEGNLSSNYKESLKTKTGFSAGVFARIGEGIYLQPELLYTERNGSISDASGSTLYDIKVKNIDIPVLVGFKLVDFLRINAGPVATLKLKEEHTFLKNVTTTVTEDEAFKNATFGYQLGAGLSFGKLDIDVRKEGSLGSISSKHFQDEKFNQKMDGWQVTLGLRIL
ncbi:MAG: PorT family protein [Leadbetterella sp.]|nr:PorT family protein [Leadbetterella sp.]